MSGIADEAGEFGALDGAVAKKGGKLLLGHVSALFVGECQQSGAGE